MIAIALTLSLLCPPDSVSAGAGIYIQTIPASPIVGQTVQIQCWVYWFPWSMWGPNAAVGGGSVTLMAGGQVFDATPTNGVPLLGEPPCATNWYCQLPTQTCVFTNTGSTTLIATYLGYADVYPIVVSQVRLVGVRDNRLHYENGRVYWFGEGSYALESSEDLRTWIVLSTLTSATGYYEYLDTGHGRRFFRTRRL